MGPYVDTETITKQIIISLVHIGQLTFQIGGSFTLETRVANQRKTYSVSQFSNTLSMSSYRTTLDLFKAKIEDPVSGSRLKKLAMELDRYYRSETWWEDRLGVALACLWNAMCAPSRDHTFIGLTMALEAVLSTSNVEISHQLAERIAVVLGGSAELKYDTYKLVKKDLYGIRSKLVHGDAGPKKKGKINTESLAVMARRTIVPNSETKQLMGLTISVLSKLIQDREYVNIVHTKESEHNTNMKIGELFMRRLLT